MNHGTRTRYVDGCRCPLCTEANTAYARDRDTYLARRTYTAARRAERWTPAEDTYLLNGAGTVLQRAVTLQRTYTATARRLARLRAAQGLM